MHYIEKGSPQFRKVTIGLFSGALVTFAVMFGPQSLLPLYSTQFHISAAVASLIISTTTAILAVMMTVTAALSDARGRKVIMVGSLICTSLLALGSAFSPNFAILLACRSLEGVTLAGLPAVAMAYLGEEVHPRSIGAAMGIYVGGNAIGGMLGRFATGMLASWFSWHVALAVIGVAGLLCSLWFWRALPDSRHFTPRPFVLREHLHILFQQFRDPALLCIYIIGFLLMGSFVSLYSNLGYQLTAAPYNFSQSEVAWIFAAYICGSLGSAWMGKLADRYARNKLLPICLGLMALGALLTLHESIFVKIVGLALFTFSFFGGHSLASSWVGVRAGIHKAPASSLYLFFYYMGSSVGGLLGGLFWGWHGLAGVVGMIGVFLVSASGLTVLLPLIPRYFHREVDAVQVESAAR
jgi:YNFM family putative membrane transporter